MLYLVATPIGNLDDITIRAIEILNTCDYILCEDTRHTQKLLKYLKIHKPLKSFHKFNERKKEDFIISDLKSEKKIALVSDAGTPGISDPGTKLVQRCVQENLMITAIPGPCAAIAALSCSGFDTTLFQFYGFLPKKSGELKKVLQNILSYPGTTVCYESPIRLKKVLMQLNDLSPNRKLAVGREITKKFEEIKRGTAKELSHYWQNNPLKGEIVLLISGNHDSESKKWENLSPSEHVSYLEQTFNISKNDAIKMAAEIRQVPKRTVYKACLEKN